MLARRRLKKLLQFHTNHTVNHEFQMMLPVTLPQDLPLTFFTVNHAPVNAKSGCQRKERTRRKRTP